MKLREMKRRVSSVLAGLMLLNMAWTGYVFADNTQVEANETHAITTPAAIELKAENTKVITDNELKVAEDVLGKRMYQELSDDGVMALRKAKREVSSEYISKIETVLNKENLKVGELSKSILSLRAMDIDPRNFKGRDLIKELFLKEVENQDVYTQVYFLLGVDSSSYDEIAGAKSTRTGVINSIISKQNPDGSWGYSPGDYDIDTSAMVIQALGKYYESNQDVKVSLDKALNLISEKQLPTSGIIPNKESWSSENSCTLSMVIIGLTSMGIDPEKDSRFVKDKGLVSELMSYYIENTGFKNTKTDSTDSFYSNLQSYMALVSYLNFQAGEKESLFDFSKFGNKLVYDVDKTVSDLMDNYMSRTDINEWNIYALSKGKNIYIDQGKSIIEKNFSSYKTSTDYVKLGFALLGTGQDPRNYKGIDVLSKILNDDLKDSNAKITALLFMDSRNYEDLSDAKWNRSKLIDAILADRKADGGWTFWGDVSDPDLTGMAIASLAPYYNKNQKVKEGLDKALETLSKFQKESGAFDSWGENANSTAMAIIGATAMGIDVTTDSRFIKNGNTPIDGLFKFKGANGFLYNGEYNEYATSQSLEALIALKLSKESKKYYQIEGAFSGDTIEVKKDETIELDTLNKERLDVKGDAKLKLTKKDDQFSLKKLYLTFNNMSIRLPESKVTSKDWDGVFILPRNGEKTSVDSKQVVTSIKLGGETKLELDSAAIIRMPGMKGKQVVYEDKSGIHEIKYDSEFLGKNWQEATSLLNKKGLKEVYVNDGDDIVIYTLHFTTFMALNSGSGGGVVDMKATILVKSPDGIIISETTKNISESDTPYTLLVTVLNERGISYETSGSGSTIYIKKIGNLAEFDKGPKSGWMYDINGTAYQVGANSKKLQAGDKVTWNYTTNLGVDVGYSSSAVLDVITLEGNISRADIEKIVQSGLEKLKIDESEWKAFILGSLKQKNDEIEKLKKEVIESKGEYSKVTDLERIIITLSNSGINPRELEKIDLLEKLGNSDRMERQGLNGVIFGLIAMESVKTNPQNIKWDRSALLTKILESQNTDGGFSLVKGDTSSLDITAMALTALAPHKSEEKVKPVVDKAIEYLKKQQTSKAYFLEDGKENAETLAQVIIALTALEIDPLSNDFKKDKYNMMSSLASFRLKDGTFEHIQGQGSNMMATEQSLMAFLAYENYLDKKGSIFKFEKLVMDNELNKTSIERKMEFADYSEISSWARPFIKKAWENEFIKGIQVEDGRILIQPKRNLTRAEFSVLVLNMMGEEPLKDKSSSFEDVNGHWASAYIEKAKEKGIISGMGNGKFMPDRYISRKEMAIMLERATGTKVIEPTNEKIGVFESDLVNRETSIVAIIKAYEELIKEKR